VRIIAWAIKASLSLPLLAIAYNILAFSLDEMIKLYPTLGVSCFSERMPSSVA
jgi:hypothetical protein